MEIKSKEIMQKGELVKVPSIHVDDREIVVIGNWIKIAMLEEERYEDVEDPEAFAEAMKKIKPKPDIFTFWQRLPDIEPKFNYHMEYDPIAVLPVTSFDHWWKKSINRKVRNRVMKAEKEGVIVKKAEFTDEFIEGMVKIFNESPVRQGKSFWHYGKDFETVKHQFSRYLFREELIGAYFENELIGFIFFAPLAECAVLEQIISMIEYRNKGTNNALLAKVIEICAEREIPYLNYAKWQDGSLGTFKRRNGFLKYDMPRYYIPLTIKGEIALKLNTHHGYKGLIPENVKAHLKNYRKKIYTQKYSKI